MSQSSDDARQAQKTAQTAIRVAELARLTNEAHTAAVGFFTRMATGEPKAMQPRSFVNTIKARSGEAARLAQSLLEDGLE